MSRLSPLSLLIVNGAALGFGVLGIGAPGFPAAKPTSKPKDPRLDAILHGIEQRYNRAHTLSLAFTESYVSGNRARQSEAGTLLLKKPGRMRWEYAQPAGKLFLSDGKHFYLYTPSTQRVERSPIRNSEDLHAPMAFLLGNLNFYKEFSGFSLRNDSAGLWVGAEPNSDTLPFSQVEFLVTADFRIRRMRITEDDLSLLDFTFENETLNPPVDASRFVFQMPRGAEFEDTSE